MLEEIRIYLMRRFSHQRQEVSKWRGNFGPNVIDKMNLLWTVVPSIDHFPPRPTVTPRTEWGGGTSNVPQGTEHNRGNSVAVETEKTPIKRTKMMAKRGEKERVLTRVPCPIKTKAFEEHQGYNDHNVHTYMEKVENYKACMRKTHKRFRFNENENLAEVSGNEQIDVEKEAEGSVNEVGNEAQNTGLNDVEIEYENGTEIELENEVDVQVQALDEVENDGEIMTTEELVQNMIASGYQQHEIDEKLQKVNEEKRIIVGPRRYQLFQNQLVFGKGLPCTYSAFSPLAPTTFDCDHSVIMRGRAISDPNNPPPPQILLSERIEPATLALIPLVGPRRYQLFQNQLVFGKGLPCTYSAFKPLAPTAFDCDHSVIMRGRAISDPNNHQ
ncbi:hypothetical protein LXL04_017103 [Taraxacum kok-saghyz]